MKINLKSIVNKIPVIDSSSNYWLVRADSGKFYQDFLMNSYIGLAWNDISLKFIKESNNDTEKIKSKLKESKYIDHENTNEQSYGTWANQLIKFVNGLKINDIVVVPSKLSEFFLVGKIISDPYEIKKKDLVNFESDEYSTSDYLKRRHIKWIGNFSRDEADTALYKMIYSQHTLSDINSYKPYINRALFDAYIEDNQLHITFEVTQDAGILASDLGRFMYQISDLYQIYDPENDVITKVNVQSPGPIEIIFKNVFKGALIVCALGLCSAVPYGGKFDIGNDLVGHVSFELPGIANVHQKNESQKLKNEEQRIKNNEEELKLEKDAVNQAVKMRVPISKLGLKLPKTVEAQLQDEVDSQIKKEKNKKTNKKIENND